MTCARRPGTVAVEFHPCDIRDDDAVKALIDTIVADHGRLDVVINNAGGSPHVPAAEASAKFSRKILELNLLGALSVSTHANQVMQGQESGGAIVNIGSVSGRRPTRARWPTVRPRPAWRTSPPRWPSSGRRRSA